ncbi:MAG: sulfate reduction electron transfer complex DsrMKJOP subunit DsrJ [Deltaproteobacteria bacterium]
MYDANKILIGLVIFLGLMTYPVWSGLGRAVPAPKPEIETPEIQKMEKKRCVEETHYMKTTHMQLLNQWRDEALRRGEREYTNARGEKILMSLQLTCMKCHSNKDKFCDSCHNYTGVKPYCWDCHLTPKQIKEGI